MVECSRFVLTFELRNSSVTRTWDEIVQAKTIHEANTYARDKVLLFVGCCEDATTTCRVNVKEV